jgi:Protein of unknown function (DUF1592)/Protein of unknown function (DUF1588)/Protein of unknown function (DUF1595)/Hint domain/Protein of unknown function (DUF1585)
MPQVMPAMTTTLSALGLLVLAASSGCGGRVGSQSESTPQAGGAQGVAGKGSGGGVDVPDPPIYPPLCFAAGTSIATPTGPRPIEQIEVGQEVLGYDETRQLVVVRPVTARMRHADALVGQLVLGDGRTIVSTPDHPIYVSTEGRYRPASELATGAELLSLFDTGRLSSATASGFFVPAAAVQLPVFNITVAGVHNYFAEGILVHNKSPLDPCEGLPADEAVQDLVALTEWEHARSVQALTGVAIEQVSSGNYYSHHGMRLPTPGAYYGATQLQLVAAAAKAASVGAVTSLACPPESAESEACARDFLENFVARTYRRPLAESERSRYLQLFRAALAGSDMATALSTVAEAALQSPHFLYKVELLENGLSDHELATRLSYFLTGLPPDAALAEHADNGTLQQSLQAEVERLSATLQLTESLRALYGAWLGLDRLVPSEAAPAELVEAMRGETEAFFDWHASKDEPVSSLLTAPFTFLDERMATHYGLPTPSGERARVELDMKRHAGALTHASLMTAYPSITRRGRWLREALLCQDIPDPPPNIVFPPPPEPGVDHRAWLEEATANAPCQGCHLQMDPLGFAFESFDRLGKWRAGNDHTLFEVDGRDRSVQGAAELMATVVRQPELSRCLMSQWLAWALKRVPSKRQQCEAEPLVQSAVSQSSKALVQTIAVSQLTVVGVSAAVSVEEPLVPEGPVVPLSSDAERSAAARALVIQELDALRQKLPKDANLTLHRDTLQSLPAP